MKKAILSPQETNLVEKRDFIALLTEAMDKIHTCFEFHGVEVDPTGNRRHEGTAYLSIDLGGFKVRYKEPFIVSQVWYGSRLENFPDEGEVWLEPRTIIYETLEDGTKRVVGDLEIEDIALELGLGCVDYQLLERDW